MRHRVGAGMIELILGSVWPYVLGAGGVVVAFVAAYLRGRKNATDGAEKRASDEYIKTRNRMDEVNTPTHGDDVDKWLRDRSKSKRDL